MNKDIEQIVSSMDNIENKDNVIYFMIYDTKTNPRAAIKYIYDMALTLKENGYNAKLIAEDKTYGGVEAWLGDTYKDIEILSLKDQIRINIEDVIVVPEYYSNTMESLRHIKSIKVILLQQTEYMFETLPVGSRWSDFNFDKCITTTDTSKNYIKEYFPEALTYVVPPFIGDNFKKTDKPVKPFIAISCRDKMNDRKIISQFYLKYPQLRWVAFKEMNGLTYEEFAENLSECMVSVWVDEDSAFGTFPLESMKCGVPVIGKIPNINPEWLTEENGIWVYDTNEIVDILGSYVLNWIEGHEIAENFVDSVKSTYLPYNKEVFVSNVLAVFNSLLSARIETLKKLINKLKEEE
jgi:hypothetical protein